MIRIAAGALAFACLCAMGVCAVTARTCLAQGEDEPVPIPETVRLRELERDGQTLWLYLPKNAAPCGLVAIAPAGGTLLTAPPLAAGDRAEHVPYARAGLAVVAYSLSGAVNGSVPLAKIRAAMADFAKTRGGVADARKAIAAALAEEPSLAVVPLAAAGHSSAANLALALAAEDPQVRAVVAFAPAADTMKFLEGGGMAKIATDVPGALALAAELSPVRLVEKIRAPVFLFHAEDDDVVPLQGTRELERRLAAQGRPPRVVTAQSGGHYDAMVATGIPAAVDWLTRTLDCAAVVNEAIKH